MLISRANDLRLDVTDRKFERSAMIAITAGGSDCVTDRKSSCGKIKWI